MTSFSQRVIPIINNLNAALSNFETNPNFAFTNTFDALIGFLRLYSEEDRYKKIDFLIKKLMEMRKDMYTDMWPDPVIAYIESIRESSKEFILNDEMQQYYNDQIEKRKEVLRQRFMNKEMKNE